MIDTVPAITIRREIAVPAADLFDAAAFQPAANGCGLAASPYSS